VPNTFRGYGLTYLLSIIFRQSAFHVEWSGLHLEVSEIHNQPYRGLSVLTRDVC
jgi:hypothetical protein